MKLTIDGSHGEGGGQVLRTALALAALRRQPVEIVNIRAGRPRPGLRPQHLAAVRAMAELSGGRLQGDRKNSTALLFAPGPIRGGRYDFRIETAGAATLLAAAILPPLLFADASSEVVITGGTHVPYSPVFHYFQKVFLPAVSRLGGRAEAVLERWGWYPAGGGVIRLLIEPVGYLRGYCWKRRGSRRRLELVVGLTSLPEHIARREANHLQQRLGRERLGSRVIAASADCPGNSVFLKAEYDETTAGFSSLGARGKPAEQVAEEVWQQWRAFETSGATVDIHLADQLIPYLALARGESLFFARQLSGHLRTNMEVAEMFLPVRFHWEEEVGRLVVRGSGFG